MCNDVQTVCAEHAHDTPHHDLRGMLHALDDTVLSETFCRHATDALHLLVLALDYALVMNPIENLWSILKSKMHKKTITNKRQLIQELISAWTREDRIRDACKELVHSMPARVAAVNNGKGSFTKY